MKKTIIVLLAFILVYRYLTPQALAPETIRNSLADIESKMEKITLELLYTWGHSNEDGYIFKTPCSIAVDSKNFFYIADSSLHCIKVFDANRRFVREIGGRGQGPGDILAPLQIGIDANDTIWVFESGNRRIQAFSETGKSRAIFKVKQRITSNFLFPSKNQIALFDDLSTKKGEGIIAIFEQKGIETGKIGKQMLPPQIDLPMAGGKYDYCNISFNQTTKNYAVAYKYSQMIQLFQERGELKTCILYDTPLHKLKLSWDTQRRNYDIVEKKKYYSECIDSDIDNYGRLFLVVSTRLPKENEGKSMMFYRDGTIDYIPRVNDFPEKTDIYRLMVFGTDGKILAAKQLDISCDEIYIHKDRLFLIDKTFTKTIHEFGYKIMDRKGDRRECQKPGAVMCFPDHELYLAVGL